mmetsp:Transcript_11289/g.39252  ORF Transcript_11289/g.39252 Transcript_11289/m.39252 type:complete len:268 (+) Transcript_11289:2111-2914(+)
MQPGMSFRSWCTWSWCLREGGGFTAGLSTSFVRDAGLRNSSRSTNWAVWHLYTLRWISGASWNGTKRAVLASTPCSDLRPAAAAASVAAKLSALSGIIATSMTSPPFSSRSWRCVAYRCSLILPISGSLTFLVPLPPVPPLPRTSGVACAAASEPQSTAPRLGLKDIYMAWPRLAIASTLGSTVLHVASPKLPVASCRKRCSEVNRSFSRKLTTVCSTSSSTKLSGTLSCSRRLLFFSFACRTAALTTRCSLSTVISFKPLRFRYCV